MRPFFKDDDFNHLTEIALGAVYHQAADVGEVLSTVERIRNGHARSWADGVDRHRGQAVGGGHGQFWPGQSPRPCDKLPVAQAELIRFTEAEGADSHCEPAANGIRGERIFDWLDQHVPA